MKKAWTFFNFPARNFHKIQSFFPDFGDKIMGNCLHPDSSPLSYHKDTTFLHEIQIRINTI